MMFYKTPTNVSNLLPPDARDLLVHASEAPANMREAMIDLATETVKEKYPQFFQKEQ